MAPPGAKKMDGRGRGRGIGRGSSASDTDSVGVKKMEASAGGESSVKRRSGGAKKIEGIGRGSSASDTDSVGVDKTETTVGGESSVKRRAVGVKNTMEPEVDLGEIGEPLAGGGSLLASYEKRPPTVDLVDESRTPANMKDLMELDTKFLEKMSQSKYDGIRHHPVPSEMFCWTGNDYECYDKYLMVKWSSDEMPAYYEKDYVEPISLSNSKRRRISSSAFFEAFSWAATRAA